MRRMALGMILAGYFFVGFILSFSGVDLLIDAVGFLLIFNGTRTLAKYGDGFGPCGPLCLGLTAVAALQLFLGGVAGAVLLLLRAVAEAALYLLLARGLAGLPAMGRLPALAAVARVVAAACATLLAAAAVWGVFFPGAVAGTLASVLFWLRVAFMAVLVWAAAVSTDERPGPA